MAATFRTALENLYKYRKRYNTILIKSKEAVPRLDFDFTLAFGNLIVELNMVLKMESATVGEPDYLNFGNAIQGNISEYPFSPFLEREFANMEYYSDVFKEIMQKYSEPFISPIDRSTVDMRLRKFRLLYLMAPVIYKFQTEEQKHLTDIERWKSLISPIIYNKLVHYSNFANEICVYYVSSENDKIFELISFLEEFCIDPPPSRIAQPKAVPRPIIRRVPQTSQRVSRPKIPAAVRNIVWYKYVAHGQAEGRCFCCKCAITHVNFEVGHVQSFANGGDSTIENFRPLCGNCNKSMGKQNLIEFMAKYGIKND